MAASKVRASRETRTATSDPSGKRYRRGSLVFPVAEAVVFQSRLGFFKFFFKVWGVFENAHAGFFERIVGVLLKKECVSIRFFELICFHMSVLMSRCVEGDSRRKKPPPAYFGAGVSFAGKDFLDFSLDSQELGRVAGDQPMDDLHLFGGKVAVAGELDGHGGEDGRVVAGEANAVGA